MKIRLYGAALLAGASGWLAACGGGIVAERGELAAAGAGGEAGNSDAGGARSDGPELSLGGINDEAEPPQAILSGEENLGCSDDCAVVLDGELDGIVLDHGFGDSTTRSKQGVQGSVGKDGYLFMAAERQPAGADPRVLSLGGGLVRLPSFAGGDAETWYCVDHGTSRSASNGRGLFRLDGLSKLGKRDEQPRGTDWLKGPFDPSRRVEVPGKLGGITPVYATLDGYGDGDAELLLGPEADNVNGPWLLVALGANDSFRDLFLFSHEWGDRWGMAFPSPESFVLGPDANELSLEAISPVAWCPGEPVDGRLDIYVDLN